MPYGHITRVEPALGFGWLVDEAGIDYFFVREGVRAGVFERLTKGEHVTFDFESTPKGPRASNIRFEFPQEVE
jgi:cold shock CspA family protein